MLIGLHIKFLLSTYILKSPKINFGVSGLFSFYKMLSRFSMKVILLYRGDIVEYLVSIQDLKIKASRSEKCFLRDRTLT